MTHQDKQDIIQGILGAELFQEIKKDMQFLKKEVLSHTEKLREHDKQFKIIFEKLDDHTEQFKQQSNQLKVIFEKLDDHQYYIDLTGRQVNGLVGDVDEIKHDMREIKSNMKDFTSWGKNIARRQGEHHRLIEKNVDDIMVIKKQVLLF